MAANTKMTKNFSNLIDDYIMIMTLCSTFFWLLTLTKT